jgi:hypothetical protein
VILSKGPVLHVPVTDLKSRIAEAGDVTGFATLEEVQRKYILTVLEQTGWVFAGPNGAAARLGIKGPTLQIPDAKTRNNSSATRNERENSYANELVPTGWRHANAPASPDSS